MQKFIALGGVAPLPDAKYGTVWSRVYLAYDVDARIAELEKALASSPCACTLEMVQATNMMILTSRITKCPRCAALSL